VQWGLQAKPSTQCSIHTPAVASTFSSTSPHFTSVYFYSLPGRRRGRDDSICAFHLRASLHPRSAAPVSADVRAADPCFTAARSCSLASYKHVHHDDGTVCTSAVRGPSAQETTPPAWHRRTPASAVFTVEPRIAPTAARPLADTHYIIGNLPRRWLAYHPHTTGHHALVAIPYAIWPGHHGHGQSPNAVQCHRLDVLDERHAQSHEQRSPPSLLLDALGELALILRRLDAQAESHRLVRPSAVRRPTNRRPATGSQNAREHGGGRRAQCHTPRLHEQLERGGRREVQDYTQSTEGILVRTRQHGRHRRANASQCY
jgi:hypothetical protein